MADVIQLIDQFDGEVYGPYDSVTEAKTYALRSGFTQYSIWLNGKRIEIVGEPLTWLPGNSR